MLLFEKFWYPSGADDFQWLGTLYAVAPKYDKNMPVGKG